MQYCNRILFSGVSFILYYGIRASFKMNKYLPVGSMSIVEHYQIEKGDESIDKILEWHGIQCDMVCHATVEHMDG